LEGIIFCTDFNKNATSGPNSLSNSRNWTLFPIVVEQSSAWNADERRSFAGQFRFLPLWFKFHPELNDAISSLQSFYSRHRRFSMNRTVFSFVKQRATGTMCALFPQKSQKFLCLVFTLPGREFAQNHRSFSLFFSPLFFFFVSFAHSRAQDCVVKFVTFHYCGLRYQNSVVDENPASADHRACESWKLLSPIKSPSVCSLLFSFFLHLYPTKDERGYIS